MTQKLAKLIFRDTGFLTNATKEEKNCIIALRIYYQIRRFDLLTTTVTKTKLTTTDNFTGLSVLSLNINGLSADKKRNTLYEKLTNKNINIILLQETHSTKQNINKWGKKWAG